MDPAEDARLEKVAQAAQTGGPAAQADLLVLLGDQAWRVRAAAVDALLAVGSADMLAAPLLEALRDPDNAGRRNAALTALSRLGREAVPMLMGVLNDSNPDLRKLAVDALGWLSDPASVPGLVGRLADPDANVRAAAAESIGRIGGPAALSALEAHLGSAGSDPLEACATLLALGTAHAALSMEQLIAWLEDPLTRHAAVTLLPFVDDPRAAAKLYEAACAPGLSVAGAALGAICAAGVHAPTVRRLLDDAALRSRLRGVAVALLTAHDEEVAASAAVVSSWVADEGTAEALLRHRQGRPWDAAVATAFQRGGAAGARRVADLLAHLEPEEQALALDLLATMPDHSTVATVAAVLETASPETLVRGLAALVAAQPARAAALLVTRLSDPSMLDVDRAMVERALLDLAETRPAEVRAALGSQPQQMDHGSWGRALAAAAQPEDRAHLRTMTGHATPSLRAAGCAGLQRTGNREDAALLQSLLLDEDPGVRAAAARALGALGSPEHADALAMRVSEEGPPVLDALLEALARLDPGRAGQGILGRMSGAGAVTLLPLLGAAERLGGVVAEQAGVRVLAHGDPEVVRAGIRALGAVGTESAARTAGTLLTDARWEVRHAAAQALAHHAAQGVVPKHVWDDVKKAAAQESHPLVKEGLAAVLGGRA